jgi:acyl carrier protein
LSTRLASALVLVCLAGPMPLLAAELQSLSQVLERTRAEVAKLMGKPIEVDTPLERQGADELDMVEIIMLVEETFDVEIPDSALGPMRNGWPVSLTLRQLAEYAHKHQKPAKKAP